MYIADREIVNKRVFQRDVIDVTKRKKYVNVQCCAQRCAQHHSIRQVGRAAMIRRHLTKIFAAANERPAKKATRGFHVRKSCRFSMGFRDVRQ